VTRTESEGLSGPVVADGWSAIHRPAPVPFDDALPHMSRVLDLDAMTEVIRPLLKPESFLELSIKGLRYKPGQRLTVHYQLGERPGWSDAVLVTAAEVDYTRKAARAENVVLARAVDGRGPAITPLAPLPELHAMLFFLPLDPSLPTLAEPPDALWSRLQAGGLKVPPAPSEPKPLGYRARRRAVVGVGDHVLKFYASTASFDRALRGLRMTSGLRGVRTAPLEAAFSDVGITAQGFIHGPTPPPSRHIAERVGVMLAGLHATDPAHAPGLPASQQLIKAARRAELLCAIAPAFRTRVRTLFDSLTATEPRDEPLVACHGDMHVRQLIDAGDQLALIDFDSMCAAPAAMDLSAYAGRAVRRSVADLEVAVDSLDALVEGYGRRPPALGWFLSTYLLRRAPSSFRHMDGDWMERVEAMLLTAEEALRL
jgi:phosphotransferase family enzyme